MAHVLEALLVHRPVGVVVVVATEREPHRPGNEQVVPRPLHPYRVVLLNGQVAAVGSRVARPPGADGPVVAQLAVVVDLRPVSPGVRDRDQRRSNVERLSQRVVAVHARRSLNAVEMPGKTDCSAGWPVVSRPEIQSLAPVPVPGSDDRLGRPDLQSALHRSLIRDRLAEGQDDGHAYAVGLVIALENLSLERIARRQGSEPARGSDWSAGASSRRRSNLVRLGDAKCPLTVPDLAAITEAARHDA